MVNACRERRARLPTGSMSLEDNLRTRPGCSPEDSAPVGRPGPADWRRFWPMVTDPAREHGSLPHRRGIRSSSAGEPWLELGPEGDRVVILPG